MSLFPTHHNSLNGRKDSEHCDREPQLEIFRRHERRLLLLGSRSSSSRQARPSAVATCEVASFASTSSATPSRPQEQAAMDRANVGGVRVVKKGEIQIGTLAGGVQCRDASWPVRPKVALTFWKIV